jgi:GNAT superfamily N-acetyltransferase
MELTIRTATVADAPRLGGMNRHLCDDERSRNRMSVAALVVRMERLLSEGWRAVLFQEQSNPIGYSLFRIGSDNYDPAIPEVYIRQFFIVRERRNRGVGRQAFTLLTTSVFPPGSQIHLDVLATNPRGRLFWESVGFQHYSTALRLIPRKSTASEGE